ncbi:TPA: hypothetical protein ACY4ZU_004348 [Yersinia enterocolitica]|uniref:hypothetical protein n=1 Tax=Yersinia enterocolitica TaxID=630 RepID=UPI0028643A55|nr:TetR/AcrR family transcriptional regulator [Yersinia enterocolitica]EKN5161367.1 TetR/AcrR family transcriptional regulator [Yersinia enterocolitica]EKN6072919.1 TetR/AcrR family transcriptional regulator [Yersinia enterocolitica]ELI8480508.1 TetR/AcrR family transcriptional regulator [Yersinia enterocolitica]HDL6602341.1 TetR/AcrR family transcriptional regulator [Yersinia enterocolitica]
MFLVEGLIIDNLKTRKNRGRPRTFDLDIALSKAVLFFKNNPFNDCTLSALMSYMNLTTGSFYKAFGSKNKIFHTVLEVILIELDRDIERILEKYKEKKTAFRYFLALILSKDGIYGNELLRNSHYISKDDFIVRNHIEHIQIKIKNTCKEILSNNSKLDVNTNYNAEILCNYLIGIYFSHSIPTTMTNLEEKIEELTIKFIKDN